MPETSQLEEQPTTLERHSGVPLYIQIHDFLRAKISNHSYPWGAYLPPEQQLAQEYGVSRMTLRQALTKLEHEGLIERLQGIGTRVCFPRFHHETKQLASFSEDIRARGMLPTSRLLQAATLLPSPATMQALALQPHEKIDLIERVRYANGFPVGIHTAFLLSGLINVRDVTDDSSLYALLEQGGTVPSSAEETLEAVGATQRDATHLAVPEGTPLLLVIRTTLDHQDRPIEQVFASYRNDMYRYTVNLTRQDRPQEG